MFNIGIMAITAEEGRAENNAWLYVEGASDWISGEKESTETIQADGNFGKQATMLGVVAVVSAFLAILLMLLIQKKRRGKQQEEEIIQPIEPTAADPAPVRIVDERRASVKSDVIGKVHNIGSRSSQQDSFGTVNLFGGVFAVVADGMGGLSDGDKVSQKIVLTMMQDAAKIKTGQTEGRTLYQMLANANQEVNRMLGASNQYRSGSTVIAVMTEGNRFQWISVGDSRIYLFRSGQLLQINNEHIYEAELLQRAINQKMSFTEACTNKQKDRVTSFVGMGELKHVDGSLHPIETQAGDKILLMSDGIFHTLSEREMCSVLVNTKDAKEAAAVLERQVLVRQNPKQDNFTAVILEF